MLRICPDVLPISGHHPHPYQAVDRHLAQSWEKCGKEGEGGMQNAHNAVAKDDGVARWSLLLVYGNGVFE